MKNEVEIDGVRYRVRWQHEPHRFGDRARHWLYQAKVFQQVPLVTNGEGKRGSTCCELTNDEWLYLFRGFAFCSRKDQFSRKIGRQIAFGRAVKQVRKARRESEVEVTPTREEPEWGVVEDYQTAWRLKKGWVMGCLEKTQAGVVRLRLEWRDRDAILLELDEDDLKELGEGVDHMVSDLVLQRVGRER